MLNLRKSCAATCKACVALQCIYRPKGMRQSLISGLSCQRCSVTFKLLTINILYLLRIIYASIFRAIKRLMRWLTARWRLWSRDLMNNSRQSNQLSTDRCIWLLRVARTHTLCLANCHADTLLGTPRCPGNGRSAEQRGHLSPHRSHPSNLSKIAEIYRPSACWLKLLTVDSKIKAKSEASRLK